MPIETYDSAYSSSERAMVQPSGVQGVWLHARNVHKVARLEAINAKERAEAFADKFKAMGAKGTWPCAHFMEEVEEEEAQDENYENDEEPEYKHKDAKRSSALFQQQKHQRSKAVEGRVTWCSTISPSYAGSVSSYSPLGLFACLYSSNE